MDDHAKLRLARTDLDGTNTARRHFSFGGLVGACTTWLGVNAAPAWAAERPINRSALTSFVLQDIEFKLLTWIPPGSNPTAIEDWTAAIQGNLAQLRLIYREAALDPKLEDVISNVRNIVTIYKDYLRDLLLFDYVNSRFDIQNSGRISGTMKDFQKGFKAGEDLGISIVSFLANATVTTGKAALTSGVSLVSDLYGAMEAAERQAQAMALLDSTKRAIIANTRRQIDRETAEISETCRSLASSVGGLKVPVFFRTAVTGASFESQTDRTPFAHAAKAYALLKTDPVGSARQFVATGNSVSSDVTSLPRAAAYVASYYLIAGHLLEHQARETGQQLLNREAIQAFDQAYVLLSSLSSPSELVAYPYLVANARALARTGDRVRAQALLRRIRDLPEGRTDAAANAERAYDLATLYSMMDAPAESLQQLRASYKAMPRRDPRALEDPLLAKVTSTYRRDVENIVFCPLVGVWKGQSGEIIFFVDGSFSQTRSDGSHVGRWEMKGDSILLTGRAAAPDFKGQFAIDGRTLTLRSQTVYVFTRSDSGFLLEVKGGGTPSGRMLHDDGEWMWKNGNAAPFSRFTTSRSAGSKRTFWYSYEDPIVGRVSQILEQN